MISMIFCYFSNTKKSLLKLSPHFLISHENFENENNIITYEFFVKFKFSCYSQALSVLKKPHI